MHQIKVSVENTHEKFHVAQGSTLGDLLNMVYAPAEASKYIAAYVNNKIKELDFQVFSSKSIRFIELNSTEGRRVYTRSLIFLMQKAVRDLLGEKAVLRVLHPVGRGSYCEIIGYQATAELAEQIKDRMAQLVAADIPITREKYELEEARQMLIAQGMSDKMSLMTTRPQYWVTIYNMAGLYGYFYGAMVTSTARLSVFDLVPYGDGFALMIPSKEDTSRADIFCMSEKLFSVFRRNQKWIDILGIPTIGGLNERILSVGGGSELIKIGEAVQEKVFSDLADIIYKENEERGVQLILIAGPSSSGKTTFSKRLSIQLSVLGFKPQAISIDDYFVDREHTPRDEKGDYDFECIEAIDVEYFNGDLSKLLDGQEVTLPRFDFVSGRKELSDKKLKLVDRSLLIVEGIHALNPALTPSIDDKGKFKIYASALTALSIDNTSVIHTTDNRLLRRIVRDNAYRGRSAFDTIRSWGSVRRGEDVHIFPYQEEADFMFNTALIFEFSVLKKYAEPLLLSVPANTDEYAEAMRLHKFLGYFTPLTDEQLPPTSLLREFVGGSSFDY